MSWIKNVSVPGYIANWMSVYKIIQILKQGHATILWRPYTMQFHHKALKKITISISIVCIVICQKSKLQGICRKQRLINIC